jgi:hypothetical protein
LTAAEAEMHEEDLLKAAHHIHEDEIQAIRVAKMKEVRKALDDLHAAGIVPAVYERFPEYVDYKAFQKDVMESLEVTWGDNRTIEAVIDAATKNLAPGEEIVIAVKSIREDEDTQVDKLLSLNYVPPQDCKAIAKYL